MPDLSRIRFPLNHWDTHWDQTYDDLIWGRQLEACKRKAAEGKVRESASQGLPDLDSNDTGNTAYGPRNDLR